MDNLAETAMKNMQLTGQELKMPKNSTNHPEISILRIG
jgi:hypothetical protein